MNYYNAWELDQRLNIRTSRGVQGRSYEGHILVTIYYLELALATEESLATLRFQSRVSYKMFTLLLIIKVGSESV